MMKGPIPNEMVGTVLKADDVVPQGCVEEKNEVKYPPSFLPWPEVHKVVAIGEDDYALWDFLFRNKILIHPMFQLFQGLIHRIIFSRPGSITGK